MSAFETVRIATVFGSSFLVQGNKHMTSKLKLLGASCLLPLAILGSAPAFAAGTTQGTDIQNTVSVNFQVGGIAQTAVNSNTDTFKVDRKVIFTVIESTTVAAGTTTVVPNQTDAIAAYTVTNSSNDVLDFSLSLANITGGAAPRGTDNIDASGLEYCIDTSGNGVCDGGETWGTTGNIENLAADDSETVLVRGDFGATVTNGQIAGVRLTATALSSTGGALTNDSGSANAANTVQNVFADVVGTNDNTAAYDGVVSTLDDYTVGAAVLSVYKSSRVVSDPVTTAAGGSNPKAIPGAVVEYCISVANATGGATATNISIGDVIPANTSYLAGTIRVDGTVASPGASQTCSGGTAVTDASDADAGSFAGSTVSGTLSNVAGGASNALIFRVTIN
jgi:uncharacterized repeat protein (TIGR01451 family)